MYLAGIIEGAEPSTNYSCHLQAAIRVASVLSGVCLERCVAGQQQRTTEYRVALVSPWCVVGGPFRGWTSPRSLGGVNFCVFSRINWSGG